MLKRKPRRTKRTTSHMKLATHLQVISEVLFLAYIRPHTLHVLIVDTNKQGVPGASAYKRFLLSETFVHLSVASQVFMIFKSKMTRKCGASLRHAQASGGCARRVQIDISCTSKP